MQTPCMDMIPPVFFGPKGPPKTVGKPGGSRPRGSRDPLVEQRHPLVGRERGDNVLSDLRFWHLVVTTAVTRA